MHFSFQNDKKTPLMIMMDDDKSRNVVIGERIYQNASQSEYNYIHPEYSYERV